MNSVQYSIIPVYPAEVIQNENCELKFHYRGVEVWSDKKLFYLRYCGFDKRIYLTLNRCTMYRLNVTSQKQAKEFINSLTEH